MEHITYDEFKKLDMRIGTIKLVEPVPDTDKLLRFEIDFGPSSTLATDGEEADTPFGKEEYNGRDIRQIVSGIREFFPDF